MLQRLGPIALFATAACFAVGGGSDEDRPSIVLFIGDDHGRADLGCYGNAQARTPNLDRLAAEGARFTGVQAVTAICQPSRATLLTGRYPQRNGVYGFYPLAPGIAPISAILAEAGYACALVGKRHIAPLAAHRFSWAPLMDKEDGRDQDRYLADVRGFLDQRDEDDPFFLVIAFHDPHRPFPTTGVDEGLAAEAASPVDRRTVRVPAGIPPLPVVREDFAGYLDAVARLDRGVGAILGELEARELLDDSLVLYTSDHGPPFPFAKTTLYERGLAVPFLARWPGKIPAGLENDRLLSLIDVAPTLLELTGLAPRPDMDGISFWPHLSGRDSPGREVLFASQTDHAYLPSTPMRSVRTERYRYIYNFHPERRFLTDALQSPTWRAMAEAARNDPRLQQRVDRALHRPREELYDLALDPDELEDVSDDPGRTETMAHMRALLVEAMESVDDPFLARYPEASDEQRASARDAYERYRARQQIRLENYRLRALREQGDAGPILDEGDD